MLAERYFAHEVVETRRAALQYQKHCTKLGQEPCSDEEMQHLESQYAAALSRYGRNFKTQQGWAAEHLKKASPKIEDIFEAVELDHLVPTIAWQAIMFTQIQRACCSS
ncbi:hypothetical protein [Bradyrhizobium sp. th.b2]|uniref:hypothetical protein n=1 Tax=Bradyrhizobium TaxID=374 RepID=UPI0035296468